MVDLVKFSLMHVEECSMLRHSTYRLLKSVKVDFRHLSEALVNLPQNEVLGKIGENA